MSKKDLTKEIIEAIPVVIHQSPLVEIDRKIQDFETLLKNKRTELANTSLHHECGPIGSKTNKEVDAEVLIAGGDIEALVTDMGLTQISRTLSYYCSLFKTQCCAAWRCAMFESLVKRCLMILGTIDLVL